VCREVSAYLLAHRILLTARCSLVDIYGSDVHEPADFHGMEAAHGEGSEGRGHDPYRVWIGCDGVFCWAMRVLCDNVIFAEPDTYVVRGVLFMMQADGN
jgi:hypothetical protein